MPQLGDGQLPERAVVVVQRDPLVQDARGLVRPGGALQLDPSPGRRRGPGDLVEELRGPSPQRDELDPHPVQLVEVGVGRQLGVEDQFLGQAAGPLLPEVDEAEDLVVLLVLAQLAVGIAEDAGVGVLGQERQHPLLPPAPLGDVVLLDQGVVAVEGDRVEVEVERRPPFQAQAADRVEPVAHQLGIAGGLDPATVFGQERPLGDDVQAGEEGQSLVEHGAHDVTVACVAEELQGQQRPHGATRPGPSSSRGIRPARGACPDRRTISQGRNRNRPPNLVRKWRGVRSSWRTSAMSATTGRGWSGRSSSSRRGSLAKPSSLKIAATAAGLSDSPSRARARLMSWTERFCFRRATTCSRSRSCLPGGRPSRAVGTKKSRSG